MVLIDTHSHIYGPEFDEDRLQVIQRAKQNDVQHCFLATTDYNSIDLMLQTYALDKDFFVPMVGLYPSDAKENVEEELSKIKPFAFDEKIKGIGEIGLDFYWNRDYYEEQLYAFRTQMIWSKELNDKPVSIHARKAVDEALHVLKSLNYKSYKGVFHCFSGDLSQAHRAIDMGFLLGIGGVLTFKGSHLEDIVRQIDLEYLVLETDSPYLSPVPLRGKRNEPMNIKIIAQKIADIKGMSLQEVANQSTLNAMNLFSK